MFNGLYTALLDLRDRRRADVHLTQQRDELQAELASANRMFDGVRAQRDEVQQNFHRVSTQRDDLLAALKDLSRGYVNMLESARERIRFYGGDCDSVEQMERADPRLKVARDVIAKAEGRGT